MEKVQFSIFSVAVILFVIAASAEGLECYNCLYIDSKIPPGFVSTHPSEKSCKPGKTPDKKFLVDCSTIDYYTRSSSTFGTSLTAGNGPVNEKTFSSRVEINANVTYTCGKLSVDGKTVNGYDFEAIFRTCIASFRNSSLTEECNKGTITEVVSKATDNEMKGFIQTFFGYLNPTNTDANVCTCNKDKCNGASVAGLQSVWALLSVAIAGKWLTSK